MERCKLLSVTEAAPASDYSILASQCFEIPGVKIFSYQAPIYYGNRSFFRDTLRQLVGLDQGQEQSEDPQPHSRIEMNISTVVMFWAMS